MTPQMLSQEPNMLAHTENIQNMDKSELNDLFMQLIQSVGPDILQYGADGGPATANEIIAQLRRMNLPNN